MKKILALFAISAMTGNIVAADYLLDPATLYADIVSGVNTSISPAYTPTTTKYELTNHVVSGIFTVYSPDSRRMRIDVAGSEPVEFSDGSLATYRLEPNGASNTTNGRIIYIDCPSAGTLTVGAWTGSAARGYTVNSVSAVGTTPGVLLFETNKTMEITTAPHPIHTYSIANAGMIALVPTAGFYYGFVKFSTTTSIQNPEKNTANYKLLSEGIEIEGSKVKVNIFNSLSQLVKSSNENYVSTSDLSKGNYIVTIEADGAASTVQIMK